MNPDRPTPRDKPKPSRDKPSRPPEPKPAAIVWQRVEPAVLKQFDPASKVCTMNCGPHRDDPRSEAERKYLCEDCLPAKNDAIIST
jgi:hypothetical protein